MDSNQWSAVQKAFDQISLLTGKQREQALQQLQSDDEVVYQEVNALLGQESKMHGIFGNNPFGDFNFYEDEGLINAKIGSYRLTKLLGYGGMGSVFLAERQDQEFEQEVAIKLIRPRKYSEATVNRFRDERQILANLNHPHIGQLFDGGSMEDGRMYFTMEYLPWPNLEVYIEEKKPSLSQRLEIFKKIASGIAYAHSQLVLHLDIKPKNILVSPTGEPKILDFGISQRFFSEKEALTVETDLSPSDNRYTMAFASPEQLSKGQLSTQSDIYSLGGLLYFLITDNLPFGKSDTTREAYLENVMSGKFTLPSISVSDTKLKNQLTGDLDAICKKALELKTDSRYASVDQMIRDVNAFQNDYPVSVREQENLYRFQRFVKRNRAALSALALFMISIIGLTTYYTKTLATQRNIAVAESQKSQQLMSFMTGIFTAANPYENQGDTISVGSYLEKSLPDLDTKFKNQPAIKSELLLTLGQVYNGLNNYDTGDSLLNKAHQTLLNNPELPDSLLAHSYFELANSKQDLGYYEVSMALARSADSLYQLEKEKNTGAWNPLLQGRLYTLMATSQDQRGKFSEADSLLQIAFPYISENVTSPSQELADILILRGATKRHLGLYDEAEKYYTDCLAIQEALHDPPNSEIAVTLNHFTSLHYNKGEYDKAIEYGEESLKQRKAIFGKYHRETMASASNLARTYKQKEDYDKAKERYLEIIDILLVIYPEPHPYHGAIYSTLGDLASQLNNFTEAISYFDKADLVFMKIGKDNPQATVAILGGKGKLYMAMKKYPLAESLLKQQLEVGKSMYPPEHPTVGGYNYMLGKCYYQMGKKDKALNLLKATEKIWQTVPDKYKKAKIELATMLAELESK